MIVTYPFTLPAAMPPICFYRKTAFVTIRSSPAPSICKCRRQSVLIKAKPVEVPIALIDSSAHSRRTRGSSKAVTISISVLASSVTIEIIIVVIITTGISLAEIASNTMLPMAG